MLASDIVTAASALAAAPDCAARATLRPYRGCIGRGDASVNQFLLLLKPHMLDVAAGVDASRAVSLVLSTLAERSVEVAGVAVLSSGYVTKHALIPQTYGTLNLVARRGEDALSSLAAQRLDDVVGEHRHRVEVSGAFQFLQRTEGFTDESLCVLANNIETAKLAAGSYASLIDHFGTLAVVLNAFHPYQLRTMTRAGTCAVALECWSPRSFHDLRSAMVGGIFPDSAEVGSLRRALFDARDQTGIRGTSPQLNYVHISPGPLEAAHHLVTYFSDPDGPDAVPLAATNVGALLAAAGVNCDAGWLAGNPEVAVGGDQVPLFDVSEDSDTGDLLAAMATIMTGGLRGEGNAASRPATA